MSNSNANKTSTRIPPIYRINQDILINIFSNLTPKELDTASLVSTEWFRLINEDSCWKHALKTRLGNILPFRRIDLTNLNWYYMNLDSSTANLTPLIQNPKPKQSQGQDTDTGIESKNEIEQQQELDSEQYQKKAFEYSERHEAGLEMSKNLQTKIAGGLVKTPKKKLENVPRNKQKYYNLPYSLLEDKAKARILSDQFNWKIEYITRVELLRHWGLGQKIKKKETELGIGTIHSTYTDFKHGYSISASLTHGVAAKTSLDIQDFGLVKTPSLDLFLVSGLRVHNFINSNSRNPTIDMEMAVRMQTVKFYTIKMNKFYSNGMASSIKEDMQNAQKLKQAIPHKQNDMKYDRVAIVWGGYIDGRIVVHYVHKKSGSLDKAVYMDSSNRHAGKVICTEFAEQVEIWLRSNSNTSGSSIYEKTKMNIIISGGSDGLVKVWNAETGALLANLDGASAVHSETYITYLSVVSKRFIVAGTNVGKVIIWDLESQKGLVEELLHTQLKRLNISTTDNTLISYIDPIVISPGSFYLKSKTFNANFLNSKSTISRILSDQQNQHILVSVVILYNPDLHTASHLHVESESSVSNLLSLGILEKYSALNGKLIETYQWPNQKPLSSIFWDCSEETSGSLNPKDCRVKLLVGGDINGNLFYWDSDIISPELAAPHSFSVNISERSPHSVSNDTKVLFANRSVMGAHATAIINIEYDGLKLLTAGQDGNLAFWEPMSLELVRLMRFQGIGETDARNRPRHNFYKSTKLIGSNIAPIISNLHSADTILDLSVAREISKFSLEDWSRQNIGFGSISFPGFFWPKDIFRISRAVHDLAETNLSHGMQHEVIDKYNCLYNSLINGVQSDYKSILVASGTHLVLLTCNTAVFAALGPIFTLNSKPMGKKVDESSEKPHVAESRNSKMQSTHIIPLLGPSYASSSSGTRSSSRAAVNASNDSGVAGRKGAFRVVKKEINSEIQNEKLKHMENSEIERQENIQSHENRVYLQSEYLKPLQDLEMSDDQLIEYAQIISKGDDGFEKGSMAKNGDYIVGGLSEEEMLQYAELISNAETHSPSSENLHVESGSSNKNRDFVVSGLSEEEMLEYAKLISKPETSGLISSLNPTFSQAESISSQRNQDFVVSGFSEEEMLQYALFLSKN